VKNKPKKRTPKYINKLFPVLILIISVIMGIGYATVSSISMDISGVVTAKKQEGVFITNISYDSNINADVELSTIKNSYGTNMSSYIKLTDNKNSQITYAISVYNDTDVSYYFDKVVFKKMDDGTTYSNDNITYKLTNLNYDDELLSKQTIVFYITFYYLDSDNIDKTDLT